MERILLACENENTLKIEDEKIDVYIALVDKNLVNKAAETAMKLRSSNFRLSMIILAEV
jgi:histidyl-tRNA synthetase